LERILCTGFIAVDANFLLGIGSKGIEEEIQKDRDMRFDMGIEKKWNGNMNEYLCFTSAFTW
jgi:hypothetical protein